MHFSAKRVGCVVCVSGLNSVTPITRDVINWLQAAGRGGGCRGGAVSNCGAGARSQEKRDNHANY